MGEVVLQVPNEAVEELQRALGQVRPDHTSAAGLEARVALEAAAPIIRKRRDEELLDRLEALAPHEISCNCGEGGTFEAEGHPHTCPRRQFRSVLDAILADPDA